METAPAPPADETAEDAEALDTEATDEAAGDGTLDTLTVDIADADITDIAFGDGKVQITFRTDPEDASPKSVIYTSSSPLHPDFVAARTDLISLGLDLMEIKANAHTPVEVTGVAFKTNSDEAPGAVIKLKRAFSKSLGKHALNTPVRFLEDKQPRRRFESDQWNRLVKLRAEARLYLGGKSAAPSLFDQQQADDKTADAVAGKLFGGDGADTPTPAAPPADAAATADAAAAAPAEAAEAAPAKTAGRRKAAAPAEADDTFDDGGAGLRRITGKAEPSTLPPAA